MFSLPEDGDDKYGSSSSSTMIVSLPMVTVIKSEERQCNLTNRNLKMSTRRSPNTAAATARYLIIVLFLFLLVFLLTFWWAFLRLPRRGSYSVPSFGGGGLVELRSVVSISFFWVAKRRFLTFRWAFLRLRCRSLGSTSHALEIRRRARTAFPLLGGRARRSIVSGFQFFLLSC